MSFYFSHVANLRHDFILSFKLVPWTGYHSIAGLTQADGPPFRLTFTPLADLELSVYLTLACVWTVGES